MWHTWEVENAPSQPFAGTEIAVLGLGYVGCVTAACLARLGHRVVGIDPDAFKVRSVLAGEAPFYEPGLEELVHEGVAQERLSASTDLADGLRETSIALVCVGTPSEKNGDLNLAQLERVTREIAGLAAGRTKPLTVAVRSTVFPGTCEELVMPILGGCPQVSVVSNPEFLREGNAVRDFMEPSLIVVGGPAPGQIRQVADIYSPLGVEVCRVSLRTAEAIKYACNAFHAMKIAFANEIGALCEAAGVSGQEVMETLCRDHKLNLSPAYLEPGFAFGGSCLPKDLRALAYRAARRDLKLPLLDAVLPSNEEHLRRALQVVLELPASSRLGVFGLAFKENTDDLRESPVVAMLEQLIGKGRDLRVFDPHIQLDRIYGSNQRFLMAAIPHIGKLIEPTLQQVLDWADRVVVVQKPSPEYAGQLRASGRPLLNFVGAW